MSGSHEPNDAPVPVHLTKGQIVTLQSAQLDSTARYLKGARDAFKGYVGQSSFRWSDVDDIRTTMSIIRTELDALEAIFAHESTESPQKQAAS